MNREELLIALVKTTTEWPSLECHLPNGWSFQDGQYVHTLHDPITIDDWNRAKIAPGTKVRILSKEHEAYLRIKALEAGYLIPHEYAIDTKPWISYPFLFFSNFGWPFAYSRKECEFDNSPEKEIFIEMPTDKKTDINARVLAEKVGSKHSAVHNPKHYEVIEGVEAIELIAASLTLEQWRGYCLGNIMKYRLRAGKKDDLQQDIDKANEYEMLYSKYADTCKGV